MQLLNGAYLFSASDLVHFLECEHLTVLDLQQAADGLPGMQQTELDESAALIARKGNEHERAYLERLRAEGRVVVDIAAEGGSTDDKVARTLAAMRSGVEVIYQATLRDGPLFGHADFLVRVDRESSAFGDWRYEVADTKLARSPKAKFLVQLAFYSRLLALAQEAEPNRMHVVLGDQTQRSFRCADYMHYFNALLARFQARVQALVAGAAADTYGLPCGYCDLCHWRERCKAQLVADDHLCQVASIRRTQWTRLQEAGVGTMAKLAELAQDAAIPRLNPDTFVKLQSQAALQEYARRTGERKHLVLPLDPDLRRGFFRMPLPDAGDMFFDMEGDPLEIGGLEYLFGVGIFQDGTWTFKAFWAHSRAEERVAFEQFMDFVTERRRQFPDAHIYHYASYEESALKRLSSMHATREVEVDNLLRQGALVDLYKVVREGIRISEPSYSIKYVEHFYRPAREGDVQNAGASIVYYERWRETQNQQLLRDIEDYNRDDVDSTLQLRDWLLTLRPVEVAWKTNPVPAQAVEGVDEAELTKTQLAEQRLIPYRERLVDALPADRTTWTAAAHASELTWQLLDFHRRADKTCWWELFARMDMTEEDLLEDPECLTGLVPDPANPPQQVLHSIVYTYLAPEQETKRANGDRCTRTDTAEPLGKLAFDEASRRVQIKLGLGRDPLPTRLSIGPTGPIASQVLIGALYRFADSVEAQDHKYAALQRLLLRQPPQLTGWAAGQPVIGPGQDLVKGSIAAALAMDHTFLYVQGPPGSGKTYTGSRMIVALLAKGWRVGVMSNSHKAINHLLAGVMEAAAAQGHDVNAVKKCTAGNPDSKFDDPVGGVENVTDNGGALAGGAQLVAGTAGCSRMRGPTSNSTRCSSTKPVR